MQVKVSKNDVQISLPIDCSANSLISDDYVIYKLCKRANLTEVEVPTIARKIISSYKKMKHIFKNPEANLVIIQHSSSSAGIEVNLPILNELAKEDINLTYTKLLD